VTHIERPSIRSYVLRGDRQRPSQVSAYQRLWDIFGIELEGVIDPQVIFPLSTTRIMEIGTGMGEGTAQIAERFPDVGFIGVDVHKPGIGALLGYIEKMELANLRVVAADAHLVLHNHCVDHSFDAFHLFFPDPWQKRHHFKRRIVQSPFLDLIYAKLKLNGYIHIATDWAPYADWIAKVFAAEERFDGGVIDRPDWRPLTKFEGQGVRKGHVVTDFKYFKSK
jgi:tRNA (guanine-N7-)-methyltransferase